MQRALWAAALAAIVASFGSPAHAIDAGTSDELTRVYARIMRDPTNSELNLRYAQLAEARGELRKSLAAYERVLVNDPGNVEAQSGLQRIRRKLQPNTTQFTVEFGMLGESNPRYLPSGARGELQGVGALRLWDERTLGDIRWRTTASAFGLVHERENDLNYGHVGAMTGPVLDLGSGLTVHPALGGSAAAFDHHFFYSEGAASITFEDRFQGLYSALRVRAAYRDYDDFFPSTHGAYVDALGKFSIPLTPMDVFIISPWVRWSDIKGDTVVAPLLIDVEPGAYIEGGSRFDVYHQFFEWLLIGVNVTVFDRVYRAAVLGDPTERRRDFLVIPGAAIVFPNLFGYHSDLRIEYKFQHDHSTDPNFSFSDHIVAAKVATRF